MHCDLVRTREDKVGVGEERRIRVVKRGLAEVLKESRRWLSEENIAPRCIGQTTGAGVPGTGPAQC